MVKTLLNRPKNIIRIKIMRWCLIAITAECDDYIYVCATPNNGGAKHYTRAAFLN